MTCRPDECELVSWSGTFYPKYGGTVRVRDGKRCPKHGTTYNAETLEGDDADSLTEYQRYLSFEMQANGAWTGRKKAFLNPNYWVTKNWTARRQERVWHDLSPNAQATAFLRGEEGHSWRITTTTRTVHPPDELVDAFAGRLGGHFRDMEHLRSVFIKGRPADKELREQACRIVLSVGSRFKTAEITSYVGIDRRTLQRMRKRFPAGE